MNNQKIKANKQDAPTGVVSSDLLAAIEARLSSYKIEDEAMDKKKNPYTHSNILSCLGELEWMKRTIKNSMAANARADLPPTGARGPRSGTEGVIGG